MANASMVAKRFIRLALAHKPEPDPLTNKRLQKLMYFAQGWSLGIRNCNLFSERIEAWAQGPVTPYVYHAMPGVGMSFLGQNRFADAAELSADDSSFVDAVWEEFRKYTADELSDMTHRQPPWTSPRAGFPDGAWCDGEVTAEEMADFFESQPVPPALKQYLADEEQRECEAAATLASRPPIDLDKFARLAAVYRPPESW